MAKLELQRWQTVADALTTNRLKKHGLPTRRSGSVLIGTFNIRKLGKGDDRTSDRGSGRAPGAWRLLARACAPFDLLAIQEVQDDLDGLLRLQRDLRANHRRKLSLLISDIAGSRPGGVGSTERMAFLYDPRRIAHTELSSEITADRSQVADTLYRRRAEIGTSTAAYAALVEQWERDCEAADAAGRDRPAKPWFTLPTFLTFIRAPHVASFRVRPRGNAEPLDLLAVNAHLLYGKDENERLWEFLELVEWLANRAKYPEKLYAPNLFLLGDCNLETENLREAVAEENPPLEATASARDFLEWKIKRFNSERLTSRSSADANFPLLDDHPRQGPLRTNARQNEAYDQIGLFCRDPRLPRHDANENVTGTGTTYDYGVFRFTDLLADLLEPDAWAQAVRDQGDTPGSPFDRLPKSVRDDVMDWVEWDVSDHLPAWIRLPQPE